MNTHIKYIADKYLRLLFILVERKNQTENLRRTLTEIEYAKEREDRLKKDLEVYWEILRFCYFKIINVLHIP